MTDFPETRESLLLQIRSHANREAWDRFVVIYRPVVYRLARQKGMQDADAQDLAQQVLMAVASAIGNWEKSNEQGRFRHWLRRVARNAILNALTRRPDDRAAGSSSIHELIIEHADVGQESDTQIELEYRRELYLQAAKTARQEVDPGTWRAFEMTVIENRSIDETALELEKPIGSIYAARSRIMRRLRKLIQELEKSES